MKKANSSVRKGELFSEYLIIIFIRSIEFIVCMNAAMYIFDAVTGRPYEFSVLYSISVPVICAVAAADIHRAKRRRPYYFDKVN